LKRRAKEPNTSEAEVTQVVALAFMALGVEVTVDPKINDGSRPDVIAWLPNGSTDLGGPVVIEVKRVGRRQRPEVTAQVKRYMAAARARTGLLVVPGARTQRGGGDRGGRLPLHHVARNAA
jgi:hypothetical protein